MANPTRNRRASARHAALGNHSHSNGRGVKILCAVAMYPSEPYMYQATFDAINSQKLPDGVEMEIAYYHTDGIADGRLDIMTKHNTARQKVIDGDYAAMWSVEADMIVPSDALAKLLQVDADVVYGLYSARSTGMWLCFPEVGDVGTQAITANARATAMAWGNVIDSEGVGMGCTLIRRAALEQVSFRLDSPRFHDDWIFAQDVKRAGLRSKHHCGVICGHILNEKLSLWPDPDARQAFRRYAPGAYSMI